MKNLIIAMSLFLSMTLFAQSNAESSWFDNGSATTQEDPVEADPGGMGDPVPIDNYLPLLLMAGIGLAVWYAYRKQPQTN